MKGNSLQKSNNITRGVLGGIAALKHRLASAEQYERVSTNNKHKKSRRIILMRINGISPFSPVLREADSNYSDEENHVDDGGEVFVRLKAFTRVYLRAAGRVCNIKGFLLILPPKFLNVVGVDKCRATFVRLWNYDLRRSEEEFRSFAFREK